MKQNDAVKHKNVFSIMYFCCFDTQLHTCAKYNYVFMLTCLFLTNYCPLTLWLARATLPVRKLANFADHSEKQKYFKLCRPRFRSQKLCNFEGATGS